MAGLTQLRADLAATLGQAGYHTTDHVPGRLYPPAVIISTDDPYVTEADTFDQTEMLARLQLYLVAGTATNAGATDALDQMIENTLGQLGGWQTSISAPYMAQINGSQFLTVRLDLAAEFTIQPEPVGDPTP